MSKKKRADPGPRMSKAVRHENTIFTMGHVASDRSGDIQTQTADVLERLEATLADMGSDKSKLLTVTIYLADMRNFRAMNEVWDSWVDGPNAPARTTVEVALATPDLLIEITATAAAES